MALLDRDLSEVPLEVIIDQERRERESTFERIPLYIPLPDYREMPLGYSPGDNNVPNDDSPGYIEIDM